MGKYLSSINLSSMDTFEFPLKTLPRPKGKATQVIYTVYDLPRPDASPHDEVFDAQGNLWYSDFNSQFIGKLDLKTGKVGGVSRSAKPVAARPRRAVSRSISTRKGGFTSATCFRWQLVRFDPKTEKMETFKHPMRGVDLWGWPSDDD